MKNLLIALTFLFCVGSYKSIDSSLSVDKSLLSTTSAKTSNSTTARNTQSKGVKKGNLKLNVEFKSSSETYYVVSSAIYKYDRVLYKFNDGIANVSIWDENYNLIKTIPNAVTKEYVQVIHGDEPVEIGLLSKQSNYEDRNFFGWYQPMHKKWLLSCKFSKIMIMNGLVLAYTRDDQLQTVQANNLSNKKCLQTSSVSGREKLVYSYGEYYWFENGENQYEIYDYEFKWIRTVKYDASLIYYEDGTVRVKKEKVLKSLGIKNPKKAYLTIDSLCWPKDETTMLCNIAPNDSCGYQETDDYIITKDYKEIYHQNIAGAGIRKSGTYYICDSDGDFTDRKVYNLSGKQMMSESGIAANGMVDTENGRNFYGCQDNRIHIFSLEGKEIVSFPIEDRNAIEKSIVGQYGKIVLVSDMIEEQFNIYYNDILLIQVSVREFNAYPDVQMICRQNGDVVISINQRIICITDEGKIRSDETLDEKKDGKLITVLEEAYIVSNNGKLELNKMSRVIEDDLKLQGEIQNKEDSVYYVISDMIAFEFHYGKELKSIPSVKIYDQNYKLIKTIPNAIANEYFQVIQGNRGVSIGLISECNDENDYNYFGFYQPQDDQWLLPCKYEGIRYLDDLVLVAVTYCDSDGIYAKMQAINLNNSKCIQTYTSIYYESISKYGDYVWFHNWDDTYEIYDKDFNWVRSIKMNDDVIYYEDGSIRINAKALAKKIDVDMKEPVIRTGDLCWPSTEQAIECLIYDAASEGDKKNYLNGFINQNYQLITYDTFHAGPLYHIGDYYGYDGENIKNSKVCDINGNPILSKDGIEANYCRMTANGFVFLGYKDDNISIFDEHGEVIGSLPAKVLDRDDTYFMGQCGKTFVIIDMGNVEARIYYNDHSIFEYDLYKDPFIEDFWVTDTTSFLRTNGEVAISVASKLLFIGENGEIKLNHDADGIIIQLLEDRYFVLENGTIQIHSYDE